MTNKIKNTTLLNVICSLISQIFAIISGFLLPRLILTNFGSEVNGLVSSISQFLSYISLVEGGVSGVVVASMYKPLCKKDDEKISSIIKTANKFYRKISLILIIYTMILAITYPILFKVKFSYIYVVFIILILSLNLLIQYNFSISLKLLLNADKKVYIVSIIHSIATLVSLVFAYLSIKIYSSIHLFKGMTTIAFILQPIIFNYVIKKNYKIDKNALEDKKLLRNRWDGFAINIGSFIHFNTDIVLLTTFTNLEIVSVYSVYSLVITGLQTIIVSITSGISPTMGHLYASENMDKLNKKFNLYEFWLMLIVFLVFSTTILLITPFVMIYTKNVVDVNYYQPLFGVLMVISEVIYLVKIPHTDLAYAANKFKDITKHAYIEAVLNIIISLLLVKRYGLCGVAFGTICGMLYRLIFHVVYLKYKILNRKGAIFIKKIIFFLFFSIIGIICCHLIVPEVQYNIINWVWHGIVYLCVILIFILFGSSIFYRDELRYIKKYIYKVLKIEGKKVIKE